MEDIKTWTDDNKMKLNENKTKNMIFNFSKEHQFTTKLSVNDVNLEVVNEAKLLGTIVTNNLSWNRNTEECSYCIKLQVIQTVEKTIIGILGTTFFHSPG